MTKNFTIYEIPGIKIGCTVNFPKRSKANRTRYGSSIKIKILEKLKCSVADASKRERHWQRRLGYKVDSSSYKTSIRSLKKAAGKGTLEAKRQKRNGFLVISKKKHKEIILKSHKTMKKNGTLGLNFRLGKTARASNAVVRTCPHCGKEGKSNVMFRYHFDNCPTKEHRL